MALPINRIIQLVCINTIQMDKNIDSNIEELKLKHHFNQVEWRSLRESVRLSELKRELKEFKNL